jgi:hypothetical protein
MSELLTSRQVARFVGDGFLEFPEIVPERLNRAFLALTEDESLHDAGYRGQVLEEKYRGTAVGEILALPAVDGIIRSLVGSDPILDHHCLHRVGPNTNWGQHWHADATLDLKRHFDVQLMYFPQDTPRESGGTMILPGSHFRLVHESEVSRYQNFRGQRATVCKAGTLLATHHNIWHCAQPNRTERMRYMFKIRLAATVPQVKLFDTSDLDAPEIGGLLQAHHGWEGSDIRIEYIQRIKLWRKLSGNPTFDTSYWVGRLENDPEQGIARFAEEPAAAAR